MLEGKTKGESFKNDDSFSRLQSDQLIPVERKTLLMDAELKVVLYLQRKSRILSNISSSYLCLMIHWCIHTHAWRSGKWWTDMASRYALSKRKKLNVLFFMIKLQARTQIFSLILPGAGKSKIDFGSVLRKTSE